MGQKVSKEIDLSTTCAEVLGEETDKMKVGGFAGFNFIIDNTRDIESLYHIGKKIGQGSYSVVYKAINKATEKIHAIKVINKHLSEATEEDDLLKRVEIEIAVLKKLDHPYICRLYETFQDDENVYMVLEYCEGGDLFDRIIKAKRFSETQAATVMEQIFRLFTYMWEMETAHRDVKPENFLFLESHLPIEKSTLKCIDFGFAKPGVNENTMMHTKTGTPYYVSPQILAANYDRFTDMWSCGIILYVMLVGYPPFYGSDTAEVLSKIQLGRYTFYQSDWRYIQESAKDLIRNLLFIMPSERLTPGEALQHPFIQENRYIPEFVPIKLTLIENMRNFSQCNALKKAGLQIIAGFMDIRRNKKKRDLFNQMDITGNGDLTFVEFETAIMASGKTIPSDLEALLRSIDVDGSGSISWTEFLAATLDKKNYVDESLCWAAFRQFDRNGDGVISRAEVEEILTLGDCEDREVREEFIDLVMLDIDRDGSESIDFHEFLDVMRSDKAGHSAKNRKVVLKKD